MDKNTGSLFTCGNNTAPSSAGYPMPSDGEPLPSGWCAPPSSAGRCAQPDDGDDGANGESASAFDMVLAEAKKEVHCSSQGEAVQLVRKKANELGGCSSGATLRTLFELVYALSAITPFVGERPSFEQRVVAEAAVLDPREWGSYAEDSAGASDGAASEFDPGNWGSAVNPEPRTESAKDLGDLLNPTIIAAQYEAEAKEARDEGRHHALNDFPVARYNQIIRASNDVSTLWEGRHQASAYELVKTLVFRTVISDDALASRVLMASTRYLYDVQRREAPLIGLWHVDTGLEPPTRPY